MDLFGELVKPVYTSFKNVFYMYKRKYMNKKVNILKKLPT